MLAKSSAKSMNSYLSIKTDSISTGANHKAVKAWQIVNVACVSAVTMVWRALNDIPQTRLI